jgi:hypothetical protein
VTTNDRILAHDEVGCGLRSSRDRRAAYLDAPKPRVDGRLLLLRASCGAFVRDSRLAMSLACRARLVV